MRRYWFPKHYADVVQRLRVPLGFVLVALFAWGSQPARVSLTLGLPVAVAGLAIRAWAAGHLAKNESLSTSGPYARVRNPLYVGTLLVAMGLALAARELTLAVVFAAVFVLVYIPAMELEEQHLRKLFPEYETYAARVPMLVPGGRAIASSLPLPDGRGSEGRFRWALYWRNQEYQALAGFALGVVWLLWRAGVLLIPWHG